MDIENTAGDSPSGVDPERIGALAARVRQRSDVEEEVVADARSFRFIDEDDDEEDIDLTPAARREPVLRIVFGQAVVTAYCMLASDGAVTWDGDITASIHDRREGPPSSFVTADPAVFEAIKAISGRDVTDDPSSLAMTMSPATHAGATMAVGSCVTMGPASVGKTPILRWIVDTCNASREGSAVLIRFGEPLPGYITNEVEAARVLMAALIDPKIDVIAVDSIKDLIATMGGAAMARGVPREIMRMLSQWGTVFAALGKTIVVPLNISTDNEDALNEVASGVLSNTTTAIVHETGMTYMFSGRTGEGKLRLGATWKLTFKDNRPVVLVNGRNGIQESLKTTPLSVTEAKVTQQDINRTLRLSLNLKGR